MASVRFACEVDLASEMNVFIDEQHDGFGTEPICRTMVSASVY